MAITKLNSLAIPSSTIVTDDLTYPLTNFSSTGIDDNASSTAVTIDSSQNVGIGATAPQALLDVGGGDAVTASPYPALNVTRNHGGQSYQNLNGTQFYWNTSNGSGESEIVYGKLSTSYLRFLHNNAGTFTEHMRLDSSGNLLVGTTQVRLTEFSQTDSGINLLGQSGQEGQIQAQTSGTSTLILSRRSSDGAIVDLRKDGTTVGSLGSEGGDALYVQGGTTSGAGLLCHGAAAKILPVRNGASIDATIDLGQDSRRFKDLYLSGGAYLGGTGSANHLDDYEEGSWEPTLIGASGNPTVTYHADTGGFYIKIGRLVYVTATIRTTAISGGSGTLMVGGFPFNNSARSNGDNSDGIAPVRTNVWNGTSTTIPTTVQSQREEARAYVGSGGYDQVNNILSVSAWGSTCMMTFTLAYYTS